MDAPTNNNMLGQFKPEGLPSDSETEQVTKLTVTIACPKCSKVFASQKSLYKHIRNKGNHCSNGDSEKSVKCDACNTVFSQPKGLKRHVDRSSCDKKKFSRKKTEQNPTQEYDFDDFAHATSEALVPSTVGMKDIQLKVTQPRTSLTGGVAVDISSDLDTSRCCQVDRAGEGTDWMANCDLSVMNEPNMVNSTVVSYDNQMVMTTSIMCGLVNRNVEGKNTGLADMDNRLISDPMGMTKVEDRDSVDLADMDSPAMLSSTVARKALPVSDRDWVEESDNSDRVNSLARLTIGEDRDRDKVEESDMDQEDVEVEDLELPESFNLLHQFFQGCETAVQIMTNRNEMITFMKIQRSIETITKRNFTMQHLTQIKTVFQAAYSYSWERIHDHFGNKGSEFELQISFNVNYQQDDNNNCSKFGPQQKVEREAIFYNSLKSIYKKFKCLEIPHAEFPIVPLVEKVTTAEQMLEHSRSLFEISPRAQNNEEEINTTKPATKHRKELNGLPDKLIEKVLLKEAKKAERQMFHDKDKDNKIKRLRRLPVMARIVKNVFTSEKKVSLPLNFVLDKALFSYPGHLPKCVLYEDLRYLMKITETWVENPYVLGVEYLKLDRRFDVNKVVDKLDRLLQDEETEACRGSGTLDAVEYEKAVKSPKQFTSDKLGGVLSSSKAQVKNQFLSKTPSKASTESFLSSSKPVPGSRTPSMSPHRQSLANTPAKKLFRTCSHNRIIADQLQDLLCSPAKSPTKVVTRSPRKPPTPMKHCSPLPVKRAAMFSPAEVTPTPLIQVDVSQCQSARAAMHTGQPSYLLCREQQVDTMSKWLDKHLVEGKPGSMYVSGAPGTGKTATINHLLNTKTVDYKSVVINCMVLKSSIAIYREVAKQLAPKLNPKTEKDALKVIENAIKTSKIMTLLVLDEVDQLDSMNQSVLYTVFEWPALQSSTLALVGIANNLDLTDRVLPRLHVSAAYMPTLLHYPPYTKQQIINILSARLKEEETGTHPVVTPRAISYLAGKISSLSGDIRKALDVCRRAIELAETNARKQTILKPLTPRGLASPSQSPRKGYKNPRMLPQIGQVDVPLIIKVVNQVYGSQVTASLGTNGEGLPVKQKILIASLLLILKKGKSKEVTLGKLADTFTRILKKRSLESEPESACVGEIFQI